MDPLRAASAAVALTFAVLWVEERRRRRQLELETAEVKQQSARQLRLRDEERRGRTRAEQRLRELTLKREGMPDESGAPGVAASGPAAPEGFLFRAIGTLHSCYRGRLGTPRQGGIVQESLATLRCDRRLNPGAALLGLGDFSHCWVLYVFHENTNLQREGRALASRRGSDAPPWQGLCMKVAPPRCPELRVGVLACRTPHRPNPVGLSLARIVSVDEQKGEVLLAGLDVVDGSPCLDLKPYLPAYEALSAARVPAWVQASYEEPLMEVSWAEQALADFSRLFEAEGAPLRCQPFESPEALRHALDGTLALDFRSPNQKSRHPNTGGDAAFFTGDLWFHELYVVYSLLPDGTTARVLVERLRSRQEAKASP